MSEKLDRKVKTALDETRLLVLGIQVLLGFQFQAFFQTGFPALSSASKMLCAVGLALLTLSLGLLIIASMEHRMVEGGSSSKRLVRATSLYATAGLVPFSLSLGLAAYVVIERHFGWFAGIASGLALILASSFAWLGLELFHRERTPMPDSGGTTPLATKVEQLLTEARVIIPGAQALFGFQFIAMLTAGFDEMPQTAKIVHAVALGLVAVNVILLMTPAALHRLSYGGADSPRFLRTASALVTAAPLFLAAGIAAESYVVLRKITNSELAATYAAASFLILMGFWYALPLIVRWTRHQLKV
ncbi:DUF6328 family protein [Bradyrhizobium neotropicale]|uniref:DUF6328 family protein n=1 Tax=Bradyrhizobium neotropicale TaxID=1497615 RepID=UPI001AD73FB6|nr:DUF6328 family protein [Bradyrhizobium neotropicale]MBO4228106.1 hypothetical protein [Bradyrhizobium neotropicale]